MKGFKVPAPKYIVEFEEEYGIINYIWEDIRDKYHNIISSTRKFGVDKDGNKYPVPRNEAVEKASLIAKQAIRDHFKMNEALKKIIVPKHDSPNYGEAIERRNAMQEKHNNTADIARKAIKAVSEAENVKKAFEEPKETVSKSKKK